jgi:putative addiction module component (TIGR02574 family)
MTDRVADLADAARLLTPAERAELVERILSTLDATDPRIDALWAAEGTDRLAAYDRGEITAHDFDAVLAERLRAAGGR